MQRIGVGAPDSGATWSPAYAAWGGNNRTQMIRVPGGPRIEHRGIDGSANPASILDASIKEMGVPVSAICQKLSDAYGAPLLSPMRTMRSAGRPICLCHRS